MTKNTEFDERFASLALDAATLNMPTAATIAPHHEINPSVRNLLSLLPEIGESTSELELAGTIDEGGMGLIHLAHQKALGRDVAVKSVKEVGDQRAATGLVQEAHVTGLLEHPNVVPVHTLGRGKGGEPLLVMKRVQGVSWSKILRDPSLSPSGEVDLIWHLQVLLQVCNALRIAHKRSIVHRDIKPENVMIGGFGEVYLMDWGLALSLEESENPLLPNRSNSRGLAGTPAYMAPEMTMDDADEVDFRTDVYLLGATLYEIVEGRPPHQGDSMFETLRAAFEGREPTFSSSTPSLLVEIVARALKSSKEDRYQTVDDFKADIETYLEVRGSIALTEAADAILQEIERQTPEDSGPEILESFAECRFGFKQALQQWNGNLKAQEGLNKTLELLVLYHVRLGHLTTARSILETMEAPPVHCMTALEVAEAEQSQYEERVQRLEAWARDIDPRVGGKARVALISFLGVYWVGTALYAHFTMDLSASEAARTANVWSILRTVGVGSLGIWFMRESLFKTEVSRRIMYVIMTILVCIASTRVLGYFSGQAVVATVRSEFILYAMTVAALGMMTRKKVSYAAAFYLTGAFLSVIWPTYIYLFVAGANLLVFFWLASLWRAPDTD